MIKYKTSMGKDLFEFLNKTDSLEYGAIIHKDIIREKLGIDYPDVASKAVYDNLALVELAAVDYVRNTLLGLGKYLAQSGSSYRVLLPSENARQVEKYMGSADKKLRRALKLSRNSPETDSNSRYSDLARIHLKRETIKDHKKHTDLLK